MSVRHPASPLTSLPWIQPPGDYRWLDRADQEYSDSYQASYHYDQATVEVILNPIGNVLQGTLQATNLKPNFTYQLKLTGDPDSDPAANEKIGLAGRWWYEMWDGTAWTNGQNLNDKGDCSSPSPNDSSYLSMRDVADPSSPTGLRYRFTGYLVFDYINTDEYGNMSVDFGINNSYHVIWKTSQRAHTSDDGPVKSTAFDADLSSAYDDTGGDDYPLQTVDIFGEWERLPVGGIFLDQGVYHCAFLLTEESFHRSGPSSSPVGNWAAAMGQDIQFSILAVAPRIISTPSTEATARQLYTYDVNATASTTLTYSLDLAPDTMNINPVSGLIQWTPSDLQVGENRVIVRAEDEAGVFKTQCFLITVEAAPINQQPQITSTPVTSAMEGELYSYDVQATDPNPGDTITFSLDTAPSGMTIVPATGLIQWTPGNSHVGNNPVVVRATDQGGLFDTQDFIISVVSRAG